MSEKSIFVLKAVAADSAARVSKKLESSGLSSAAGGEANASAFDKGVSGVFSPLDKYDCFFGEISDTATRDGRIVKAAKTGMVINAIQNFMVEMGAIRQRNIVFWFCTTNS